MLVDDKLQYANFFNRDDIKSQLNQDLTVLLYKNGYPPEWDETDILSSALNVKNLKRLEKEIEENMKNSDESYWQNFFSKNAWALSQLFASPLMICGGARYVGGKNITNSNAKITDFIYKNNLTNNIALIEIKTPCTKLFSDSDYRSQISNQSHELVGAVNQLLVQKQTCYENYTAIRSSSIDDLGEDFYVQNIKSILLIGKINDLSVDNKKQFERYRNELRSIEIVTFDELLEKVKALLELLTK